MNLKNKIEKTKENEIEIIMGDNSDLNISDVGDCVNEFIPKKHRIKKQDVVIPKGKKKKN